MSDKVGRACGKSSTYRCLLDDTNCHQERSMIEPRMIESLVSFQCTVGHSLEDTLCMSCLKRAFSNTVMAMHNVSLSHLRLSDDESAFLTPKLP